MCLPLAQLTKRDEGLDTPEEHGPFECVAGLPDLRRVGMQEVLHQLLLTQEGHDRSAKVVRHERLRHRARVSEKQDEWHAREAHVQPLHHEIGVVLFDHTLAGDQTPVEPLGPRVPHPSCHDRPSKLQELLVLLVRAHVPAFAEGLHPRRTLRMKRLEDDSVFVLLVDDLG